MEMDYAIRTGGLHNIEKIVTDRLKSAEENDSPCLADLSYQKDLKLIKDNISDYKKYFGYFTNIELNRKLYLTTMMYLDEDKIHKIEENIETNFSKEIEGKMYVKNFGCDDKSTELLSNVLDCIIEKNIIQPELLRSIICKTGYAENHYFRLEKDALTGIEAGNLMGLIDFEDEDLFFENEFFPYYRQEHGEAGDIEEAVEQELELTGSIKCLKYSNNFEEYDGELEKSYELTESEDDYVKLNEIGISVSPIISNYTKEDFEMYKNSPYYDDSMRLDDEKMPEIMEQVCQYHVEQAKNSLEKAENLFKELKTRSRNSIMSFLPK